MVTKFQNADFTGQKIFVGIDVHAKDFKVSLMVGQQFYKTFTTPPDPKHIANYLYTHFPGGEYYSAYEAGFSGYWIHQKLLEAKINSVVVNPADIPTTQKERLQKEDNRDSRKIAAQLQAGHLKPIYIPSDENLYDRALLRSRDSLSKESAREKQRIKSFLKFLGINYPEHLHDKNKHWSNKFLTWLDSLHFSHPSGKLTLAVRLQALRSNRELKLKLTRQIRELSKTTRYQKQVKLLMTVPGVGMLSAMKFLTEVEDIRRFANFSRLCCYFGYIPSTNSSGEKDRVGGMTSRKNQHLRKMLIECAWVAIRNDPALMSSYLTYSKRMKPTKAIVRIAKKLLSRIHHVLQSEAPYLKNVCLTLEET
jgi:transposase